MRYGTPFLRFLLPLIAAGFTTPSAAAQGLVPEGERRAGHGVAYVIAIGVDTYESPEWDLDFAVNDARVLGRELWGRLVGAGYVEVVLVPLLSDPDPTRSTVATRAAIRGTLDLLAGREVSAEVRSIIPSAEQIFPATAEDLVLISFSGRGYAGPEGVVHLFPEDIGEGHGGEITAELLSRTVSSDDLGLWLHGVDAGETVMIVDAVHPPSGGRVPNLQAGPAGSCGLRDLASERGMLVLAASRAEDMVLESDVLRQGLLSYALVEDGLVAWRADRSPRDGRITMEEWLAYATERIPELRREVLAGGIRTVGSSSESELGGEEDPPFERPALFDFRPSGNSILVAGRPAGAPPPNVAEPE